MISVVNQITMQNFHWFVAATTVMLYMYLRWKRNQRPQSSKPQSNLVYLLLWPVSLYSIYYLFLYKNTTTTIPSQVNNNDRSSTVLMSSPYPNSDSISV